MHIPLLFRLAVCLSRPPSITDNEKLYLRLLTSATVLLLSTATTPTKEADRAATAEGMGGFREKLVEIIRACSVEEGADGSGHMVTLYNSLSKLSS